MRIPQKQPILSNRKLLFMSLIIREIEIWTTMN